MSTSLLNAKNLPVFKGNATANNTQTLKEFIDAILKNDCKRLRRLIIASRFQPDCLLLTTSLKQHNGESPLGLACVLARPRPVLHTLLENGASLGFRNCRGETLLHRAAIEMNFEALQFGLEHGLSPTLLDHRQLTPLFHAVLNCAESSHSFSSTQTHQSDATSTPSTSSPRCRLIELLLQRGSPLNVRDEQRFTELHHAVRLNQPSVLQMLLRKWPSPTLSSSCCSGSTSSSSSSGCASDDLPIKNVSFQADINAQTDQGNTPLHLAGALAHEQCVRVLLSVRADVRVANAAGETAAELTRLMAEPREEQQHEQGLHNSKSSRMRLAALIDSYVSDQPRLDLTHSNTSEAEQNGRNKQRQQQPMRRAQSQGKNHQNDATSSAELPVRGGVKEGGSAAEIPSRYSSRRRRGREAEEMRVRRRRMPLPDVPLDERDKSDKPIEKDGGGKRGGDNAAEIKSRSVSLSGMKKKGGARGEGEDVMFRTLVLQLEREANPKNLGLQVDHSQRGEGGLMITEVEPGSTAQLVGLSVGDVIIEANDVHFLDKEKNETPPRNPTQALHSEIRRALLKQNGLFTLKVVSNHAWRLFRKYQVRTQSRGNSSQNRQHQHLSAQQQQHHQHHCHQAGTSNSKSLSLPKAMPMRRKMMAIESNQILTQQKQSGEVGATQILLPETSTEEEFPLPPPEFRSGIVFDRNRLERRPLRRVGSQSQLHHLQQLRGETEQYANISGAAAVSWL